MPSSTPSNSSRFQKKSAKSANALAPSSTIGAETTVPKNEAASSSNASRTKEAPSELMMMAKKVATSAPQKKAVASIHSGSAS
jgi:hypothetical protein